MKTNIALVVMVLLCLFSVRMVLQINECKSELIKVKQTAEEISVQQNAINERIKAIEISEGNYTTQPDKVPYSRDIPLSDELQQFTCETAEKYGVNYDLMLAIMQTESQFNNVVSANGDDIGLCQINSSNAEWLYEEHGIYNLMDERQNIDSVAAFKAIDSFRKKKKKIGGRDVNNNKYRYRPERYAGPDSLQYKEENGLQHHELESVPVFRSDVGRAHSDA